jgi:MtN3 and saliva related transmembrane protein
MSFLSILATISGIAASGAMLPQVYKIFKRKSAKDISILTYSMLSVISIIWILYGFEIQNFPVIISNGVGIFFLLAIIVGWFLYGRKI